MSGIDRSDQMISYYSTPRKSLRWYIKIFFHLLDVSLWNSTYVFSKLVKKMTYLEFRDVIIKSYIQFEPVRRPLQSAGASKKQHLSVKLAKRVKCYICRTTHKKRTDTYYICTDCKDDKGRSFGLCMPTCFTKWRSQLKTLLCEFWVTNNFLFYRHLCVSCYVNICIVFNKNICWCIWFYLSPNPKVKINPKAQMA